MCQQRAEYVVPCSTQSQFPYLWSAALRCTHGMAILGDPGADEMGVPSRSCNPRERNCEPRPCRAPCAFPAAVATPGAQLGPTPTQSHLNLDPRSPGLPSPGCAPGEFSASVSTSESTTGKPAPTPARSRPPPHAARVRPAPARSRYLPSF